MFGMRQRDVHSIYSVYKYLRVFRNLVTPSAPGKILIPLFSFAAAGPVIAAGRVGLRRCGPPISACIQHKTASANQTRIRRGTGRPAHGPTAAPSQSAYWRAYGVLRYGMHTARLLRTWRISVCTYITVPHELFPSAPNQLYSAL